MDTLEAPQVGADAEVTDPVEVADETAPEVGQVEDVGDPGEQQLINLDEYGNYLVPLDDGEAVPLAELRNSGLRQADYTRKTQELAETRREYEQAIALQKVLKANPRGALQWLQLQLGEDPQQHQQQHQPQPQPRQVDDWLADDEPPPQEPRNEPLEQRLERIEGELTEAKAKEAYEQAFTSLEAKYGKENFNRVEVAQAAVDRGIFDPGLLEMVYHNMKFDDILGAQQARAQVTAQKAAEDAQRQAAAQEAASITNQGASVSAAAPTPTPPPSRPMTISEAAAEALAELKAQGYKF